MSLLSTAFFGFLIAVLAVYFVAPAKYRWVVLLVASYAFYLFSGAKTVVYLLFTTVSTFYAARAMDTIGKRVEDKRKAKHQKRCILAAALVANFGILLVLKYSNFAIGNFNALSVLFDFQTTLSMHNLLLPLGISFYIYQTASYLVDVYRGKHASCESLPRYTLFVAYFPQMVQGPISRYSDLAPQLFAPHHWDPDNAKHGIQLMLWGYFKKVIIADRIAVLVDTIFGNYQQYGGAVIFFAVICYCIQLYCDFSGGIDIIRGASQIMGITLADNFRRPYFSRTISEFWRRWHITLGTWMKDYLFYPLSLSRRFTRMGRTFRKWFGDQIGKLIVPCLVTVVVFLAVGLWQGSSWKWIAYGLWNGGLIALGMLFAHPLQNTMKNLRINPDSHLWHTFQLLRTVLLMCVGRYFSRATTLMTALRMMKRTVVHFAPGQLIDGTLLRLGLDSTNLMIVVLGCAVLLTVSLIQERGHSLRSLLEQKPPVVQFCVTFAGVLVLVVLGIYAQGYISSEFIYGNV